MGWNPLGIGSIRSKKDGILSWAIRSQSHKQEQWKRNENE